jgi:hypothetical protein
MEHTVLAKIFEGGMLLCFGTAWPFSILKLLRVKCSEGKSFYFLYVVFTGYIFGIFFKVFKGVDIIIFFYIFNLVMVSIDIFLSHKYRKRI